jgi:hypothetical protein
VREVIERTGILAWMSARLNDRRQLHLVTYPLIVPSSTIQRNSPQFATAEISPRLTRLWLTRNADVRPGGA